MGKIGFVLIILEVSMADSECLLIPTALVSLGSYILWRGGYVG